LFFPSDRIRPKVMSIGGQHMRLRRHLCQPLDSHCVPKPEESAESQSTNGSDVARDGRCVQRSGSDQKGVHRYRRDGTVGRNQQKGNADQNQVSGRRVDARQRYADRSHENETQERGEQVSTGDRVVVQQFRRLCHQ